MGVGRDHKVGLTIGTAAEHREKASREIRPGQVNDFELQTETARQFLALFDRSKMFVRERRVVQDDPIPSDSHREA